MNRTWTVVLAVAVSMTTGCMNLGGGRQTVTLPWSYPAIAMDATGSQIKNGGNAGAQFGTDGTPAGELPTGDQVMTVGSDQTNARATDVSAATKQGQATQSAGTGINNGTGTGAPGQQNPNAAPTSTTTPTLNIPVSTGGAATVVPSLTSAQMDALSTATANRVLEALKSTGAAADTQ